MTTTQTLTDSISSLSSSGLSTSSPSRAPSISRIYKQASQLFLTRQLAEAWEVLVPLTLPPTAASAPPDGGFGLGVREQDEQSKQGDAQSVSNGEAAAEDRKKRTQQISAASKSARVKIWGLWLALIHELLQLGAEEGGRVFAQIEAGHSGSAESQEGSHAQKAGSRRWRQLCKKVQEGEVWEEVVSVGYQGNEGAVDGEVVANLATLLLQHAPAQQTTQSRLETYLSATTSGPSPTQLTSALENGAADGNNDHTNHAPHHHHTQNGTSTPADLNTRLKLLEIYTLHVLPANSEWDYARTFISMSEILDEERKEAFLAALGSLREESEVSSKRESELQRRREEERKEKERRQAEEERRQREEERNRKMAAEMGLGSGALKAGAGGAGGAGAGAGGGGNGGNGRAVTDVERERERKREEETKKNTQANGTSSTPRPARKASQAPPGSKAPSSSSSTSSSSSSSSSAAKRPKQAPPARNFVQRASNTIAALQRAVMQMGSSVAQNPLMILRMLLFMVALVMALGRRDVRERVGRAWDKVRETVGMGVKTTYL